MQADDLRHKVRSILGLNDYEARAYLELLRSGPMRAPELARRSRVPTGRIYDVLKSLEAKGLVVKSDTHYRAVDPRIALEAYSARLLEEARRRVDQVKRLASELENLSDEKRDEAYMTRGLEVILRIAATTLSSCPKPPVFLVYKAAEKIAELWERLLLIVDLIRPGSLIVVSTDQRPPTWAVEAIEKRGARIVFHPAAMIDAMIACNTVIIGVPGGGDEVAAVIVRSKEFAEGLESRVRRLIQNTPTL